MGTGNLTELTDSDSSGVNATLMGLASELSISAVLVVQGVDIVEIRLKKRIWQGK